MPKRLQAASVALLVYLAIYLAAGVAAEVAARAQDAQEVTPAVRQGVQATLDAYRELAAAGKWEALMRLYADDPRFRWVANGIVEARTVEEIRKTLMALPPGSRIENSYNDPEITLLAPGCAQVTTQYQTRFFDPRGGGFAFGGALTMTLIERGGGWKILNGHASALRGH